MKNKYTLLIASLAVAYACGPLMAAHAEEISAQDISGAQVTTLTTTVTKGSLTIANGRNCLTENAQNTPILSACQDNEKEQAKTSMVHFIEIGGKCLIDNGDNSLSLTACDHQDKKQQWLAEPPGGTEVRNIESNNCLTSAGLDKPVKTTQCNGIPAQNWTLPN
jgi:hypothetical protein